MEVNPCAPEGKAVFAPSVAPSCCRNAYHYEGIYIYRLCRCYNSIHQMKNKYHTVETVPKSNRKKVQTEDKLIPLTHIYMAAHLPGLVQAHFNTMWVLSLLSSSQVFSGDRVTRSFVFYVVIGRSWRDRVTRSFVFYVVIGRSCRDRVTRSFVFYVVIGRSFSPFSFGLCVIGFSSIYGFWLPLCGLRALCKGHNLLFQ